MRAAALLIVALALCACDDQNTARNANSACVGHGGAERFYNSSYDEDIVVCRDGYSAVVG